MKNKLNGKDLKVVFIDEVSEIEVNCLHDSAFEYTETPEEMEYYRKVELKHKMYLASFDAVRKLNPLNL